MKIKRFLAPNMREALKAVRTEQGPEAVILSNRRVGDYVEVIAALDYDEALIQQAIRRAPRETVDADMSEPSASVPDESSESDDETTDVHVLLSAEAQRGATTTRREQQTLITELDVPAVPEIADLRQQLSVLGDLLHEQVSSDRWANRASNAPMAAQLLRNLSRLGMASDVAESLCNTIAGGPAGVQHPWRDAVDGISDALTTVAPDLLTEGGVAAFVGPTGVGKTTTIAKLASQYALRHGARDIALVSMDGYRIGAREQLFTFGRIINASVFEAESPIALRRLLAGLSEYRLVLIDTAGVSQRDTRLAEMLDGLSNQSRPVDLYLTLAATADEQLLDEIVRCYQQVSVKAAAITKIDEASRLGAPLSVLLRHGLPLGYVTDGQCVPDDLVSAQGRKLWLVNQALAYAKAPEFEPEEQDMARLFGRKELING